jgi:hypothetical protein
MLLTQFAIKNAKPREKPYKLADGNGLYLLVNPNGSKRPNNPTCQSKCSLSSRSSAAFPARLASVMVSKKISEHSIALFLPAR